MSRWQSKLIALLISGLWASSVLADLSPRDYAVIRDCNQADQGIEIATQAVVKQPTPKNLHRYLRVLSAWERTDCFLNASKGERK